MLTYTHAHTCTRTHTLQSGHFNYRGVPQALRSIWTTEGAKGTFAYCYVRSLSSVVSKTETALTGRLFCVVL